MRESSYAIVLMVALVALQSAAVTIHRSFRTREVGVGFGTGGAGVAYPVDAKVDKAIDEARQKEAEKAKVVIGRCTKVCDDGVIHVVTDGNVLYKVCPERIDVPGCDQPAGKDAAARLSSQIRGKKVRVEWQKKDQSGRILGTVRLYKP